MRAKEYLSQLGKLRWTIDCRKKQLEELRNDITFIKGLSYGDIKVQSSPSGTNAAQSQMERIVDLEAQLQRDIVRYHSLRYKITRQIEQLSDLRYREILIMRYVDGMGLQDIADEMGYSYDWVRHQHGYALIQFKETTNKNT